MQYFYLHGFASSPLSTKAKFFSNKFAELGISLNVLDLNLGDFSKITVSKQLDYILGLISDKDSLLIGSSLGGLLSLMAAQNNPYIHKLILLAPAIGINKLWKLILTPENLTKWQKNGSFPIYHYGYNQEINLEYRFIEDLAKHEDSYFKRQVDTLIFHGLFDETIPVANSIKYVKSQPQTTRLIKLDSDHSLENNLQVIWSHIQNFIVTDL